MNDGHVCDIIKFPKKYRARSIETELRPDGAIELCRRTGWKQFLGIGITEEGEFEVVNSDMTAERALWLVKWAERWAMGLDEAEVEA